MCKWKNKGKQAIVEIEKKMVLDRKTEACLKELKGAQNSEENNFIQRIILQNITSPWYCIQETFKLSMVHSVMHA